MIVVIDYVADDGKWLAPSGYLEGVKDFKNPHTAYEYQWGVGDIVTAVIDAGLTPTSLNEYPYMNGAKLFLIMRETANGRMIQPENLPELPLMISIVAERRI